MPKRLCPGIWLSGMPEALIRITGPGDGWLAFRLLFLILVRVCSWLVPARPVIGFQERRTAGVAARGRRCAPCHSAATAGLGRPRLTWPLHPICYIWDGVADAGWLKYSSQSVKRMSSCPNGFAELDHAEAVSAYLIYSHP